MRTAVLLLAAAAVLVHGANPADDEVKNLPGVTFELKFKHYAGYLDASLGNHLHYWFFESQSNAGQSPLVLWLNGGPGCSSIGGSLMENGPFRPTQDGQHLQENPFSWNKIANVIYIDSPRGVGYSYRDNTQPSDGTANDTKTTEDLVLALQDFVRAYPQLKFRDFYITGESYAGVYVPQLANALLKTDDVNLSLKGFAVGNGLMNLWDTINSAVGLTYYRGMIGKPRFDALNWCVTYGNVTDGELLYADFSSFIDVHDDGKVEPKKFDDEAMNQCAQAIYNGYFNTVWTSDNRVYNTYTDCYVDDGGNKESKISKSAKSFNNYEGPFVDQGVNQFPGWTDPFGGFPCFAEQAAEFYMNLPEVRDALHAVVGKTQWVNCGDIPYIQNEHDMSDVFEEIINSGKNIRVLVYSGDLDMADSFMANQWFVERLAETNNIPVVAERNQWVFARSASDEPGGSGMIKQFAKDKFTMDLLTVKGAGHQVPMDRPGPALQMISNFIFNTQNYSNIAGISADLAPLLPEFQPTPEAPLSRKEADRIFDLPGLTFEINFNQYAGYLNGVKGNYLHYWLFESQSSPDRDPLVLWLSGGPGCSGYTAALWGSGPYRPNRDGTTLSENVYSWNKVANIFFIDSPRNVGFSFQNYTENNNREYSDSATANDLYVAILDFFDVYPEYHGRPFYIAGESYGGVYGPSTAVLLIDQIVAGRLSHINFAGLAAASALLDQADMFNAAIQYQYYHGVIGKDDYDALQDCCTQQGHPGDKTYFEFCDYTPFVEFDKYGTPHTAKDCSTDQCKKCAELTMTISNTLQIGYNAYASCYELPYFSNDRPELVKPYYAKKGFEDQARIVSHESSDSQDAQFCWGQIALGAYLNTPAVQAAIHVRQNDGGEIMPWKGCSDDVAANYEWDYKGEMRPFFDRIIASGLPFKFLIFNGDIDMVCNFISDQWFTERLTDFYNMKVEREYGEWRYLGGIGGYAEKFSYLNVTVDFVTVKGAGHFCALDRPGPTLQVLSSYLHNRPLETKVPADLELAPLKQRYVVEETVGRQKDLKLDATKTRAKRAAKAALPPPPPACNKVDNKIDVLPGLTFDFTGNHFSGYLNAGSGSYLFYWLVEAESDPSNKPLILWLNGGPGCSSLSGLLKAMGPYLTNLDGETLYENIFAWNKIANVLYIESPKDVGFSYQASDSDPNTANKYSDSLTAEDNVRALVDFLNCHDNYKNRKLYITGESYAGVYVPTFVDLLLRKTISKEVTGVDLAGFAIGNGDFSPLLGINTAISLTYFKGFHSKKQFESLARCVPNDFVGPMTYFDWTQYINIDIRGQPHPLNTDESTKDGFCGAEIIRQAWDDVWNTDNDVYDTFSDCYERNPLPSQGDQDAQSIEVMKRAKRDTLGRPMQYSPFIDGAKRLNYQSTDNNGGLQCANPKEVYLNIPEVRKAIHVPDTFTKKWQVCSDTMEDYDYEQQYNDTTPIFKSIFASTETLAKPLRVMFYHGDADMACTFLQGQWFTDSLAKKTKMTVSNSFGPWIYEQINGSALTNPGGYLKSYDYKNKLVTLDLITIKGAGHMVPVDLPGPMMQVMNNFITNVDFNTPIWQSQNLERKPLTAEFLGAPDTMTSRMEADRIYELPGLTYDPNFRQYSGYLQASEGNKLFYWFVESQNKDPLIYTPVVLWLNGGPGCSSIIGMMQENGPFRVNPDQRTLWENVYSWNKAAHVVYIDSPRRVGFSYQNMTENADDKWDDDKTASDAYLAIEEFFRIHPEMKLRDFYTSGESYCGVYVPLITAYLVKEINAKRSTINLKGMMIGNGELSFVQDIRSTPSFGYYHGMTGKTEYDSLSDCCPGGMGGLYCHYDDFINPLGWKPRPNLNPHDQACADKFVKLIDGPPGSDNIRNDDYNLYQDCYALPAGSASESRMNMKERVMMRKRRPSKLAAQQSQQQQSSVAFNNFNPVSTDNNGGFYCYMDDATENYLNQPHVRSAIHVPDQVQRWESCSDTVGAGYKKLYEDMTGAFEDIMSANFDMRALIYNGDVDFVCHFMQAQWFVEALSKRETWQADNRKEWRHRGVIAGYVKQFDNEKFPSKNFRLDLVTVKGAGHYVPMDRPGPALQMISNFLRETQDYSKPVPYSLERKPLLPQYTRKGVPSDVVTSPTDQPTPSLISTVTPSAPPTTTSKTTTTNPPVPTTKTASAFATITSLLTSLLALFALFN